MSAIDHKDLRRMVAAVAGLRGCGVRAVRDVTLRSDARHLKMELASGLILVVSAELDDQGHALLAVDLVEPSLDASARQQIEVRFD